MNKNVVATFAFRFASSLSQGIWDYNALPQYIFLLENQSSQVMYAVILQCKFHPILLDSLIQVVVPYLDELPCCTGCRHYRRPAGHVHSSCRISRYVLFGAALLFPIY